MSEAALQLDYRASESYCREMARREAANFYWGFIALPRDRRVAIYALYDFARQVDDDADRAGATHPVPLDGHRERLRRCLAGDYADPVMLVLGRTIHRYGLPLQELEAVVRGVEMDLERNRYQTWAELETYCSLVASAVGRMCVRIFGFSDASALDHAYDLGLALQLTNILRDVKEDAAMGRIYLPLEDLARFGIAERELLEGRPGGGWEPLVRFQAARARALFESGLKVTALIPTPARVCVRTMAGIYQRLLEQIEDDPRLPLARRASLSKAAKLKVMLRSWAEAV
ncbi:MAG: phytoene/squalene synthase family protein [Candidatus Dormibacteraceae bacterium]